MQRKKKYCLWLLIALACCSCLHAQTAANNNNNEPLNPGPDVIPPAPHGEAPFVVRNIIIEGNRKTRPNIILRELSFKTGDAFLLQDLVKKFETAREQLMNTSLFHEVTVALKSFEGYNVDVIIRVRERWYIFPVPYLKPVDRNLNQWIVEQKASLSRVDYGVKLLYNNATGRNDKIRFWLINGYTRQFMITYDRPYIDKQLKWGLNVGFQMGKNHEINYNTIDDKQAFLSQEGEYLRNFWHAYTELTYRKAIKTRHRFGIGYTMEEVSDTVAKLNPDYFSTDQTTRVLFPEFYYIMNYYDLDYIPYPTKGYAAEITFSKRGIDQTMNAWQLTLKGSGNWPTGKKSFFSLNAFATIKVPFSQPYYNRRLLGYGDAFMQGYEYYVIDGVAGGYLKASLTRKLFNFDFGLPGTRKFAPLRVPINIYGRIYGNTGYVYNPDPGDNILPNRMLYSYGIGLDVTTIYDFTLRLDWSFNHLDQNGLFLHRKSIF